MNKMKRSLSILVCLSMVFAFILPAVSIKALGNVALTVKNVSGVRGDTVKTSVNISAGSQMQASVIELHYNSNVLELISATRGSALSSGSVVINTSSLGKIVISYANTSTPLTVSGSVLDATFKIKENAGYGASALELVAEELSNGAFESIDVETKNGIVNVIAPIPDIPNDVSLLEVTSSSAEIYWSGVDGATGYNVYLNGELYNEEPIADNRIVLQQLESNTKYTVKVTSLNYGSESGYSEELEVQTMPVTYSVLFVDDAYEIIEAKQMPVGETLVTPEPPEIPGKTFVKWVYIDANGAEWDLETVSSVESDLFIVAKYISNHIMVKFINWNGEIIKEQEAELGSSVILPEMPGREGYRFGGWYSDSAFVAALDNDTIIDETLCASVSPEGVLKIYAKWVPNNSVFVLFNTTEGSFINGTTSSAIAVAPGEKIGSILSELPIPVRSEYDFAGWYMEEDCINAFDSEMKIIKDVTLYAKWKQRGQYMLGDVDGNGTITTDDALIILKYAVGVETEIVIEAADCDKNGEITTDDALLALKRAVGVLQEL